MTKQLSEDKLKELKSNALNILLDIRRRLLNDYPFLGSIAMSMDIVPVRDRDLTTAATDGTNIYFDIDFLSKLKDDERLFVFAHEIWHAALCHMIRKETREIQLFNIAADLEVNQLLKADGFTLIKDCILPKTFVNEVKLPNNDSAENYYELLQNHLNKMKKQNNMKSNSDEFSGSSESSDGDFDDGNFAGCKGNSSKKKSVKVKSLDKHIYKDETSNDSSNNKRIDRYGEVGKDPDFVPNVKPNIDSEMKSAISMAAQQFERQRGELPAHIKSIVKKLLTPKVNWKEVLQKFITTSIDNKANWNIPNRRFISSKLYLPSRTGDQIKLGVIIDTSGSTENDIPQFVAELNSIVKSFNNYSLTVCQCDADVKSVKNYDQYNPLKVEDIEIEGGGGTTLTPAFKCIQAQNDLSEHEVDCLVVFTDGYFEQIDPNVCNIPTLWIIVKDGTTDMCTFGNVIKMS